ncbi:hypothetical protein [Pseudoruegeria sp. HB172150]|uniref:hypothetical protein n=1 Tax=Pseudoruegeria sp. HB172150 TaxID=2721164 RepID=UPI0015579F84|nr:hypothetical protein [Pseudoruegeria sp. HB172150]
MSRIPKSTVLQLAFASILGLVPCASLAAGPWDLLGSVEIRETEKNGRWAVEKTFPEELKAAADGFTVTGFYVPIEAQAYVRSYLLVADPADCPFCGSNGYGPTLEVHMRRPMPDIAEGTQITVRGRLNFLLSEDTYQSVIMTEGELLN